MLFVIFFNGNIIRSRLLTKKNIIKPDIKLMYKTFLFVEQGTPSIEGFD
jgi:hypothetical protein